MMRQGAPKVGKEEGGGGLDDRESASENLNGKGQTRLDLYESKLLFLCNHLLL